MYNMLDMPGHQRVEEVLVEREQATSTGPMLVAAPRLRFPNPPANQLGRITVPQYLVPRKRYHVHPLNIAFIGRKTPPVQLFTPSFSKSPDPSTGMQPLPMSCGNFRFRM